MLDRVDLCVKEQGLRPARPAEQQMSWSGAGRYVSATDALFRAAVAGR